MKHGTDWKNIGFPPQSPKEHRPDSSAKYIAHFQTSHCPHSSVQRAQAPGSCSGNSRTIALNWVHLSKHWRSTCPPPGTALGPDALLLHASSTSAFLLDLDSSPHFSSNTGSAILCLSPDLRATLLTLVCSFANGILGNGTRISVLLNTDRMDYKHAIIFRKEGSKQATN